MSAGESVGVAADSVVLIHRLWTTPRSWEKGAQRYPMQGYRVIAPSWPDLDCEVEEIRRAPEAHVIIGHSFGGAIDSAPVKGVLPLPFSTLKSAWPVLGNPANKKRPSR